MATKNIQFDYAKSRAALRKCCLKYQEDQISGTGFSVLLKYEDISPKAQTVVQWVEDLWADFDIRDALLLTDSSSVSFEFNSHGVIPHTFKECKDEIEAALAPPGA